MMRSSIIVASFSALGEAGRKWSEAAQGRASQESMLQYLEYELNAPESFTLSEKPASPKVARPTQALSARVWIPRPSGGYAVHFDDAAPPLFEDEVSSLAFEAQEELGQPTRPEMFKKKKLSRAQAGRADYEWNLSELESGLDVQEEETRVQKASKAPIKLTRGPRPLPLGFAVHFQSPEDAPTAVELSENDWPLLGQKKTVKSQATPPLPRFQQLVERTREETMPAHLAKSPKVASIDEIASEFYQKMDSANQGKLSKNEFNLNLLRSKGKSRSPQVDGTVDLIQDAAFRRAVKKITKAQLGRKDQQLILEELESDLVSQSQGEEAKAPRTEKNYRAPSSRPAGVAYAVNLGGADSEHEQLDTSDWPFLPLKEPLLDLPSELTEENEPEPQPEVEVPAEVQEGNVGTPMEAFEVEPVAAPASSPKEGESPAKTLEEEFEIVPADAGSLFQEKEKSRASRLWVIGRFF